MKLSDLLTAEQNRELQLLDSDASFHKELEEKAKISGMLKHAHTHTYTHTHTDSTHT